MQIIDRLISLHRAGYIHCDIKPDNVLLGSEDRRAPESSDICLIDFGIAKRYCDPSGIHIEKKRDVPFAGNVLFASKNAFKLIDLSRRDDFISLCYLIGFFISGELPWLGKLRPGDPNFFYKVAAIKRKLKAKELCVDKAACFEPFCSYVFKMKFSEEPNYGLLKHLLVKCLLQKNIVPDMIFEWSFFRKKEK